MRNTQLFVLCGAAMLALAACNRESADTETAVTTPAAPPAPVVTPPPPTPTALTLATGGMGSYVADNSGRAVYVLEGDDTATKCAGDCIKAWPPVLAPPEGAPTAASPSVQAAMIATIPRGDGSQQVTYNGHPLYYYAEDAGPGTTKGHDMVDKWGEWYLVGPTGLAMEDKDSDAAVTGEAADEPAAAPATDTEMPADKETDTQADTEKEKESTSEY